MTYLSIKDYYSNSNYWIWKGYRINWQVKGEKNKVPILLLHGFGACGAHWRNNINFFAKKDFVVYSLDLLGFGKSSQPGIRDIGKLDNGVRWWASMYVSPFLFKLKSP